MNALGFDPISLVDRFKSSGIIGCRPAPSVPSRPMLIALRKLPLSAREVEPPEPTPPTIAYVIRDQWKQYYRVVLGVLSPCAESLATQFPTAEAARAYAGKGNTIERHEH